MQRSKLAQFRRRLESLRSRVLEDRSALVEQVQSGIGRETELSNAPFHLADSGSEEFQQGLNALLLGSEANLVAEVAAAIERLDDGAFGRCEECDCEIADERLEALPFTRYCIEHADRADADSLNVNHGRPRSPKELLSPFGEMEEDRRIVEEPYELGRRTELQSDRHAVGAPGGGSAVGGLAGSNIGAGEPRISALQDAAGNGNADLLDDRADENAPQSGRSGGAVGGTPAGKRAR